MSDVTKSKHWRWMPGMARVHVETGVKARQDSDTQWGPAFAPDFDDPATRGCLLHMVREAWARPDIYATMGPGGWRVRWGHGPICTGPTEADALKAALLAAP